MVTFEQYTKEYLRKKRQQEISPKGLTFEEYTRAILGEDAVSDTTASDTLTQKKKEKDEDVWFKGDKSNFDSVDNINKTVLATHRDFTLSAAEGAGNLVEGIVDLGAYLLSGGADLVGAKGFSKDVKKWADETQVSNFVKDTKENWQVEDKSIFGNKMDGFGQALGQAGLILATGGAAGAAGLGSAGVTAVTSGTTFLSSTGGGMSEAYRDGATDEEAIAYGLLKGGIDAGSEMLFGGLGKAVNATGLSKGIGGLDDIVANKLFDKVKSNVVKNALKYGFKAGGEGLEEVAAGIGTAIAKQIYSEEDALTLLKDENLLEQAIMGAMVGGTISAPSLVQSNVSGRDYVTNLTQNEQKVVDAEVESRIKEQEKNGKKLTNKEISNITKQVQEDLKKGGISTDIIERTLGGETYKNYQSITEQENSLNKKIEDIQKDEALTPAQKNALTKTLDNELKALNKTQVQGQLMTELDALTQKDTYLRESYNEKGRRSETFKADLSKYDDKHKAVIQKAIDSGILNNTNKTHDFVDFVAKVSADTGTSFDFANNQKIKESGFALEGATVDGYVTKDGITLNVQSNKSLNTVVGHEITHILEGTDLYDKLQTTIIKYAQTKGDYKAKMQRIQKLYTDEMIRKQYGKDADVEAIRNSELTADLVGEYLFTDSDFVTNLSAENPSLFKKIYEEIKHLFKLATAGSKEARELEQVKKAFDKAYKSSSNTSKTIENIKTSEGKIINTLTGKELDSKTYEVLDRLNKGETVNPNEIANLKEVEEGKLKTEELLNEFIANNPSLKDVPSNEVGTILLSNEERLQLREKIITERLNEGSFTGIDKNGNEIYNGVVEKGKRLDIVIGLPASGKSSSIVNPLSEFYKSAVIDSDIIKKKLPEYNEGWGSTLVHEESSMININLLDETLKTSSNIVLPIVGSKVSSVEKYISLAKDYGYSINVHLNELPNGKAVGRLLNRYFEEGRFINPTYAATYGNKPTDVYEQIKTRSDVDGYSRWNNDVAKGQRPKNTEISENNRVYGQYSNSWRAARREDVGLANSEATQGENTTEINDKASSSDGVFFDAPKTQYSLSTDNKGRTLSKEQQEFFKDSKVVDNNGNLIEVYHGTRKADFTVFKRNHNFFTDSQEMASSYAPAGEMYSGYLNIKKPFVIDAQGEKWSKIPIDKDMKALLEQYGGSVFKEGGKWRTSTADIVTLVEDIVDEGEGDYDGVIIKNVEDTGSYGKGLTTANDYITFNSNQFKNSDNTAPTSSDDIRYSLSVDEIKSKQLDIILNANPANDDYHTWIRSKDDILTFEEALNSPDYVDYKGEDFDDSYPYSIAEEALETGKITVYSSYPIEQGIFVSPSKMEAQMYAGNGKVYSKKVDLSDVAWIDPTQGQYAKVDTSQRSLSNQNEDIAPVGNYNVYGSDIALAQEEIAPVREDYTNELPDDYAPLTEEMANERDAEMQNIDTLDVTNIPDEIEAPIYTENDVELADPFEERDIKDVGNRKVKAYMYDNPEVKPYFQQEAQAMLWELQNSVKGEKHFNDQLYYDTSGEQGWFGTKRETSDDIAYLLDNFKYTYADIEKGLKAIIEDHGAENNAISKRIEFALNDRLKDGYTDFMSGETIPANQDYVNLLMDKQISSYSDEAYNEWVQTLANEEAPALAPLEPSTEARDILAPTMEDIASLEGTQRVMDFENNQIVDEVVDEKDARAITYRKQLHAKIIDNIKKKFAEAGFDFDNVLKNAKDKSTFSSVDNTPQRFIEKSLGYKEGQLLNDLTTNKIAQNETAGIKWLNSFTNRKDGFLAQISNQYGIKPKSKESAAAQMYGEGFYVNENDELVKYGDIELAKDFPDVQVQENIKRLANDPRIRQVYDETLKLINESRTRNLYPAIPRRNDYFLHFRAMDDTFSRLGLPFNPNDIRAKDLPTDINGMTADLKPGQPYFASAMQRKGNKTTYDLLGGLERYLNSAKNQIYHIDDIQTLRALRNYVADTYGQAHGLENLDTLTETEAEERIKEVHDAHLSVFAKFLNEEANVIAGKTALVDRGIEGIFGRKGITFMNEVNQLVGKNMVGFNVSSSLTNFIGAVQGFAKSNKFDTVKAFSQMVSNKLNSINGNSDGFADSNPLIIRRKGIEKFTRTPVEKVSDIGYSMMSAVDNITTEFLVRTKFNELTRNGMSEEQAHIESDKWASRILGDRSLGQQPQLFNSKTLGVFTKFQLEVRNQLDSQFYDTIQEAKVSNEQIEDALVRNAKTAAKITSTLVQLSVLQHLFGKAFESIAGYNPTFDIVDALMKMFGLDDEEEDDDTIMDNLGQGFLSLVEDMPYSSILTGGRIPIQSALPVGQLITGKDEYGNEKPWYETLAEALPYYNPLGGYGQVKKTTSGLGMFDEELPVAGSYTDSGNLRFPVDDTLSNRVQAAIFGQWASENARDYFENERQPLKSNQIQEFAELDIPIKEYWEYREGLKEQKTIDEKFDYIAGLDLPVSKKNILINNVVDREEEVDLALYDDFSSYEEFDYAIKNPEKYEVVKVIGYDSFKTYSKTLSDLKADKDANGKTINGSRKKKVVNYLNSIGADYGTKILLYKMEYPSDNRYNNEIVEYLNNRNDISYNEMASILRSLGFTVDADGTIHW